MKYIVSMILIILPGDSSISCLPGNNPFLNDGQIQGTRPTSATVVIITDQSPVSSSLGFSFSYTSGYDSDDVLALLILPVKTVFQGPLLMVDHQPMFMVVVIVEKVLMVHISIQMLLLIGLYDLSKLTIHLLVLCAITSLFQIRPTALIGIPTSYLSLHLLFMNMEASHDNVTVYDGNSTAAVQAVYTGFVIPSISSNFDSTSNELAIRVQSDIMQYIVPDFILLCR